MLSDLTLNLAQAKARLNELTQRAQAGASPWSSARQSRGAAHRAANRARGGRPEQTTRI